MNDDKKVDETHVGKSDKTILFLDTDVGETNTEDVEHSDELPTPGKINFSNQYRICINLNSGSLADREHRKWLENAVPMPNNPYTTENVILRKFSRSVLSQPPQTG